MSHPSTNVRSAVERPRAGLIVAMVVLAVLLAAAVLRVVPWTILVIISASVLLFVTLRRLRADGWHVLGPHFYWDALRLARRDRTILVRALYAFSLLVCLYWVYGLFLRPGALTLEAIWRPMVDANYMARFAELFAHAVVWLQMLGVLILTPAYIAGAIAEERERGSLDLLLTTYLLDREIVVGKLFGRLIHLAALSLVSLPVLALTEVFGGVNMLLLLAVFAVIGFTLRLVGSISVFVAALSGSVWQAVLVSYAVVMVLTLACISGFLREGRGTLLGSIFIAPDSPATTCWRVAVSHTLVSFALLCGATWSLRRPGGLLGSRLGAGTLHRDERHSLLTEEKRPVPIPTVTRWPVFWKEMFLAPRVCVRDFWLRFVVMVAMFVIPFLLYFMSRFHAETDLYSGIDPAHRPINMARFVVAALAGLFFLGVGFRAAGSVVRERQQGTLDSLLCLPGERVGLLAAKWWASLLKPSLVTYAFGIVVFLGFLVWALYPRAAPFLVVMLLAHVAFAASLGLLCSVVAP